MADLDPRGEREQSCDSSLRWNRALSKSKLKKFPGPKPNRIF
ncbi:hypothetical protein RTCIAT899_PC01570 (plasmid) [Rhizobium tropici CIAT 899]|nr:hypothetical protein RTCIAT899_PC01570 [Rhizobium tropici CIAT 899]